jgi:uncharacterized protein YbaP (TraB family)
MTNRKINFRPLAFLLAFCLVHVAGAEEKRDTAAAHHSLWKIKGPRNEVYLLGSVHVLKKEDYPLPAVIESAFTNAGVVAFETDLEALENPATAMKLMTKARLPEGETLQQQLKPEVYEQLNKHLKDAGLQPEMFNQLSAPMAAIALALVEFQKMGLDPEYGVDKHFFELARKANKQIIPLETVDFQIGLLTDFTKDEGNLLLKATLKDLDSLKTDFGDLVKAWKTGDTTKLGKFLNEAMEEAPVIFKRLVTNRNRNWLPKIEELTRGEKNAIVIVGAGHLIGKEGVMELLKEKGLKVTQE